MSSLRRTHRPSRHRRVSAGALIGVSLAIGLSGSLSGAALAQSPSGKPASAANAPSNVAPEVSGEPRMTMASYGDWVLRCQRLAGDGGPRFCEVMQTMQVQGQAAPVAQLAVGRLPGQEGLRVTALLPANLSFPSSVRVGEAKDAKETGSGLDLAWRRCIPGGCLAEAAASDPVLTGWRAANEAGRITFKDADGREIAVPLSFRGLGPALDALAKEKS